MFGKAALIVVWGFALTISTFQLKTNQAISETTDNFNGQFMRILVHETALSAMNMGVNQVWDAGVSTDTFQVVSNMCTSNVMISNPSADTIKVKVVSSGSVYNMAHESEYGASMNIADSVIAYFSYNIPLSRYFWFTNNEMGVYWITGDTVDGPIHTNSIFKTHGSPVFYGKVTAKTGMAPLPTKPGNKAEFIGGWEIGVSADIPTDMSPLIAAATLGNGGAAVNTKCKYNLETTFEFLSSGQVIRTVDTNPPDTVSLAAIAPTGVIHSTADVRVKGSVNGKVTIYSEGDIWIDDDIVYADNPLSNPNSDDILGLVSKNDVWVTDNALNNADVHIQAAIMAMNGSFGAQNYNGRPVSGKLHLTGSVAQENRGPVGTFSKGGSINHGFSKRYYYDPRFKFTSPPSYPYVKSLRLVSWWE